MKSQVQYKNLDHISFWEIAIAKLALWDLAGSRVWWEKLEREATWSKAIYGYGLAVCLYEEAESGNLGEKEKEEKRKEAARLMAKVPELRQRIAGKSIPLEVRETRFPRPHCGSDERIVETRLAQST